MTGMHAGSLEALRVTRPEAVDLERINEGRIGRIPVRNLWLLMLYASDLTRIRGAFDAIIDEDVNDIPDLVARLLTIAVERRFRRNFTRAYCHRERVLTRVRGRINILTTESRQLLSKGEVFCRYEELTADTPRNRLVRAALELMARLVRNSDLMSRCRALGATLGRAGVSGRARPVPTSQPIRSDETTWQTASWSLLPVLPSI